MTSSFHLNAYVVKDTAGQNVNIESRPVHHHRVSIVADVSRTALVIDHSDVNVYMTILVSIASSSAISVT